MFGRQRNFRAERRQAPFREGRNDTHCEECVGPAGRCPCDELCARHTPATHRALSDAAPCPRDVNTDRRPPYRRPPRLCGTHVVVSQLVSRTSQDASTSGSWRPSTAGGELHGFRPVLPFASDLFQQPRRFHGTAAGAVRVPSCASGRRPRRQMPCRAWCRLELRAQSRSEHRPRHKPALIASCDTPSTWALHCSP
jgi:hypothetical protein